ncbi:uncharacterized protein DUF3574 [Luteimonas cucumeris]|uniref:Uncharacterized protein DUF3574 n=1 Tax=Luteimonas cucumeris TaxID=985012 RepID=A0A562L737_9GAMM|nr:DUF3574 domain-containing protein [Luteimonas cucumeris]TWI03441.1 uncharacterized protein DUF3574 [Luteimonas cucumeris]
MRDRSLLLAGVLACLGALAGCASTPLAPIPGLPAGTCDQRRVDRLLFGMNTPDGAIDEVEWQRFLAEVVTPRFPDGLTVYNARGQWRGESGRIEREDSRAVEIVHGDEVSGRARIAEIVAEYKRRYRQEAVLVISSSAQVCL